MTSGFKAKLDQGASNLIQMKFVPSTFSWNAVHLSTFIRLKCEILVYSIHSFNSDLFPDFYFGKFVVSVTVKPHV